MFLIYMPMFMILYIFMSIIMLMYPLFLILMSIKLFYMKYNIYHPINQMIILIILILSFSIYLYLKLENSIYPLLLLITFISGILVIFSYFTALNNKPMNVLNFWMEILITIIILSFISSMLLFNNYMHPLFLEYNFMYFNFNMLSINEIFKISKIHIYILFMILLMMILYMSIKICLMKNYPLRSKW